MMCSAGRARGAALPALAGIAFWSSCGYIAEPLPPLMNVPGRAENVVAVERGSRIIIHFTVPALTTEGVIIKHKVQLDLRIGPQPDGPFNAATWAQTAKPLTAGTTVNSIAEFTTPAAEWVGKQVLIAARVIGSNGRDAGWSVPARLAVVPPPPQPRNLQAESAPRGVRLTWQAQAPSFAILRRGPDDKDFQSIARSAAPEYVDYQAQFGKPYTYIVQSLVKTGVTEAQSDMSNAVEITPRDVFPPAPPGGLTAVPSTASIELVWERSSDPAVTGYRVYRAAAGASLALLAEGQTLPAYSDHKIESGKTYRYAVSAVKSNQVESKMSEPVEVTAP